jgi:predicted nucleotidyltransferase component of viral defense system
MLDQKFLEEIARKKEASFLNVAREYLQHLFLRSFYSQKGSEDFAFKGGTALKIVFGSPRFSEDLDFSGIKNNWQYEKVLEETLIDLTREGVEVEIIDSKATTGGHLATLGVNLFGQKIEIMNQISFREKDEVAKENVVIVSDFVPPYNLFLFKREILVGEKIRALIERAKARDFFDLYFVLRKEELRKIIHLDKDQQEKILSRIAGKPKEEIEQELKRLLPRSFWQVIADLPTAILKEFGYIP